MANNTGITKEEKEKYFNKGFLVGALIVGVSAIIAFIIHLFQQH